MRMRVIKTAMLNYSREGGLGKWEVGWNGFWFFSRKKEKNSRKNN